MKEVLGEKGFVSYEVKNARGRVVARGRAQNTITSFHKGLVKSAIQTGAMPSNDKAAFMGFSNFNDAVTDTTGIGTAVGTNVAYAVYCAPATDSPSGIGARLVATFTADATNSFTGTIQTIYFIGANPTGSGLPTSNQKITAGSVNDIFAYINNFGVTLNAGDSVTVTWDLTLN